jgi:alanine-synthesizing transaminase
MQKKFYLTEELPPYIFASMYELKQQAINDGKEIIDFGMGNPDSPPPQNVMNELSKLALDPKLYGYSVTGGIELLKKKITNFYHRRFGVELDYKKEALVTIGSKEGIASLANAISDSKSYVCVPSPSYPIHTYAFIIAKTNLKHISAISSMDFLKKFKILVESEKHKPQAVIVSYPCNPTTEIANFDFYQELVDFCKKYQIYIISDIAYGELYFSPQDKPHSILEVKGAKDIAIEFYSVSKSYSLAGTRVGFALGNQNLISALYKIKSYLDYGSFTPLQMIASLALEEENDDYLKNLRNLYQQRGEFFVKNFSQELAWHIDKPKASMFCWTKLPKQFSNLSSFDFCKKMILEAGIAISPGSSFGENGEGYVRFSMIQNQDQINQASTRLKHFFSFKI